MGKNTIPGFKTFRAIMRKKLITICFTNKEWNWIATRWNQKIRTRSGCRGLACKTSNRKMLENLTSKMGIQYCYRYC